MKENSISRRSFLKSSALAGAAAGMVGTGSILTSCESGGGAAKITPIREPGTYYVPDLSMDKAKDGREIKAGIIGCGGRGRGAAANFLNAANGVTITALGDAFPDKLEICANMLKERFNIDIPADKRFTGLDNYKQVIDSGVDVVLIASPPFFRPEQFQYAIEKGKHCFLEKPLFVDAVGYRSSLATSRQADAKKLCIVTGTQRHHQRNYVESYKQIMNGMIGEITGGAVYWNGTVPWTVLPKPGLSDGENMMRNWVNMIWLSGDHIVEQHCHNLDVWTWFTGLKPVSALGFGSRHRRPSGDQFDNFSVDVVMENGIHVHSMCCQVDGFGGGVWEFIQGTKGSWSSQRDHVIKDLAGNEIWKYDEEAEKAQYEQRDPYTLEHVNWINHMRAGVHINQAPEMAVSNMAAVMGRESCYTGNIITWDAMTTSDLDLRPKDLSLKGKMDLSVYKVPVPGLSPEEGQARRAAQRAAREAQAAARPAQQ
ncbi:MAG: Gfo/Idh/MocA family oxidoreductase [Tannerella sp.]|jgi:predicted dehydrogenase|nr:Gfo/Idh/MocA family oxidoreductase [Tannerella sp.]